MTLRKKLFFLIFSAYILSIVAILCWKNTGTIIAANAAAIVLIIFSIICLNKDMKKQESNIIPKVHIDDIDPNNHLSK